MHNLRSIELSLTNFGPPAGMMTQSFAPQIAIYATSQLQEVVFNLGWEWQRWIKKRVRVSEHPDHSMDYDEWVCAENGRRDPHYNG